MPKGEEILLADEQWSAVLEALAQQARRAPIGRPRITATVEEELNRVNAPGQRCHCGQLAVTGNIKLLNLGGVHVAYPTCQGCWAKFSAAIPTVWAMEHAVSVEAFSIICAEQRKKAN